VGSEMCIRDSSSTARRSPHHRSCRRSPARDQGLEGDPADANESRVRNSPRRDISAYDTEGTQPSSGLVGAMDLNRLVSYSLRVGVFVSALLSVVGLSAWAAGGFKNIVPAIGSQIAETIGSAVRGEASGIIYLAIAVLIATPVFRVAVSSTYFACERDSKYVLISLAVLSMLIFALVSGYAA